VSQENVELVKRAWEATVQRDYETALSLYDPDVTLEPGFLDNPEVFRGLDGVREVFRNWFGVFADMTSTVEEWIDAGDDVVAILRLTGRGRQSGVPVVSLEAHVWTVRDGKLWRLRIYPSRAEALKAVGLEE
jgi:ketosteroid isomerase-like protein